MSEIKMIAPAVPNVPWQERPDKKIMGAPIWRYSENPIINRNPIEGVARIFNSAVMPYEDGFIGSAENRPTVFLLFTLEEARMVFTGILRRTRFPLWMKRGSLSCRFTHMTPDW